MNAETQIPTTVDLAASYGESGVRDVLRELDETLIGLAPVKKRIKETAALLLVDRARRNAADLGLDDRARFSVRDLDADAGLPDGVDAVLLDPPRTGAAALAAALAARPVPVVAYVSCAPATLTRDAAVLAGAGYRLERLAAVDMFPQTAHIEAMALFTR